MSTVTNIVNQLLVEDEQNIIDIDKPDKAYDALQNGDLFEAPSIRLKRTLCKLLNEKEENLITTLADSFYQFQIAHGRPYTPSRANGRAGKWLEKNTVPERETVFEICFSLQEKLKTVDAVKELITTGFGEHGFNVRSAKECVYFYCFASKKSYADAQRILDEYGKAEIVENNESKYRVESGKGNTTLLLRRQLFNNKWDTEEDFMEFLRENKLLFIEYSKSFVREYEELYNRLSSKIRQFNVGRDLKKAENANAFFQLVMREAPDAITKNTRLAELYEKFLEAKKDVNVDALEEYYSCNQEELFDIWDREILPQVKETQKPISANQMELFISQGIPRIKRESRSESYNKGKKRSPALKAKSNHGKELESKITPYEARANNKDSKLYISTSYGVIAQFPQGNDILLPEELCRRIDPLGESNPFEPLYYRKLFLLMFYYDYFFAVFCSPGAQRTLSLEFDFRAFVREVTKALYRCNLAPLYRNEHFDWLILNSAAAIVNGCTPSTLFDGCFDAEISDDGDEADGDILEWIATAMEAKDWNKWVCSTIKESSDSQATLLYELLFGRRDGDVDRMRAKMLAAVENEDGCVIEKLEDISDGLIGEPIPYEETLAELGNNPLNFFGQVLRMSYGF